MDMRPICLIITLTAFVSVAYGQSDTLKHKYTLFNPVPREKMKDMETDRPDVTESAYSVAPGHFQVESDLLRHVRNKSDGVQSIQNTYNLANYKLGLTERSDIQLVIPTYTTITVRDIATGKITNKTSGIDDISVRFKYNIWGHHGGKTALAALPYVVLPTSAFANNGMQYGMVFPFALSLSEEWNFGSQVAVNVAKEDDSHFHPEYLYSFTFGRELSEKLSAFVEGVATYNVFAKKAETFANGGLIFSVTGNLNIDAGVNIGLKQSSDKIYFLGISFRY
ncbi:hypothetical protein ABIB62_000299 [Mucilaginibacter sp. UYP25]|uniref:transporter n=1 Tax=unclassified Mucilaginibacter TaxID=2617802 RepID=UPI0033927FFD